MPYRDYYILDAVNDSLLAGRSAPCLNSVSVKRPSIEVTMLLGAIGAAVAIPLAWYALLYYVWVVAPG